MNTSFRALRTSDAGRVLDAFVTDAAEMRRQGEVTDLESAERYVARFLEASATYRTLVAADADDQLLALAVVSVDEENLNGWVFYWADPDARGRGITSSLVRTLGDDARP